MSDFKLVKLLDSPVQVNIAGGLNFLGEYDNLTAYQTGDSVSYLGSSYIALGATTGNLPTNGAFWQVLAEKGDEGIQGPQGPAGVSPDDNFSYTRLNAGQTKTVPTNQQMNVVGMFKNFGTLVVNGAMTLLSGQVDLTDGEHLPPWMIEAGETFIVKKNRMLSVPRMFVNLGTLQNNGIVYLGD